MAIVAEFIECPMLNKKVSLASCQECNFHNAIQMVVQVDQTDPITHALLSTQSIVIPKQELKAHVEAHGPSALLTVQGCYVDCCFPRKVRIEKVES